MTLLTKAATYYHTLKIQVNVLDLQTLTAYNFRLHYVKHLATKNHTYQELLESGTHCLET